MSLALQLTTSAAWLRVCDLGSGSEYIATAAYDNTQLQPPSAVCVLLPPSLLPSAFRPGPAEYNLPTDSKPGVTLKFRHERTGKDTGPSPLDYADKDFRKIYMSGYTRKVGLDARFATKKQGAPADKYLTVDCPTPQGRPQLQSAVVTLDGEILTPIVPIDLCPWPLAPALLTYQRSFPRPSLCAFGWMEGLP